MEAGRKAGHNIYPLPTLDQIISVHSEGYIDGLHPVPDAVIPRIGVALSGFGQILITAFSGQISGGAISEPSRRSRAQDCLFHHPAQYR